MTNPWDQFSAGTEFVEFHNIGDTVTGTITSIGAKRWDDGSVSPQLGLRLDNGDETTLTASWVRLVAELKRLAPNVGDRIKVTFTGKGPKPKETREWAVEVLGALAEAPVQYTSPQPQPAPADAPAEDPRIATWRAAGISEADIAKLLAVS